MKGKKKKKRNLRVFALGCHPDDIEFMMGGTLFVLADLGCELHYMNMANGSCGTTEYGREEIVAMRRQEAQCAAGFLGAVFHDSLADDLSIFYTQDLIRKVTAIIRKIEPDILLLLSPEDYMEDHMNSSRIGVTAAFCRCMPNYSSNPHTEPTCQDIALYHALPYGLRDGLRRPVKPHFFANVGPVMDRKEKMLAFHTSQKQWLDKSQGLDSYLLTMRAMTREVGEISGCFEYAEGWRRHSHLGYSVGDIDPLAELLRAGTGISSGVC